MLDAGDPTTDQDAGGLQPDLNQYWAAAAKTVDATWRPVTIAEAAHPKCGADPASEFGYCPADNTVYYSQRFAAKAYYSLSSLDIDQQTAMVRVLSNQPADYALGTLFAIGWGLAVQHQVFHRATTGAAGLQAAICYAGAYSKSINIADPTTSDAFTLSPPDLDEATSATLNLVGLDQAYGARGTTGLQRVQYFVKGYTGGLSVC